MEGLGFTPVYAPTGDGWYVARVVGCPGVVPRRARPERTSGTTCRKTILARQEQAGELFEGRGGAMPEPLTREEAEQR